MKRIAALLLTFFAVAAHAQQNNAVLVDELGHGYVNDATLLNLQSGISAMNTIGIAHFDCGGMFNDLTCHQEALKMLYFEPMAAQHILIMLARGAKPAATQPELLVAPAPEYSAIAKKLKISGVVVVSLLVDKDGKPTNPQVVKPLGYGLDEAAIAAVRQYKFAPATLNGQATSVQVNIEVNFRIN